MNQTLLSVIVPCYNVEKYLDKCISSIVGQTYANLEILLIDDGSSDNSGMLCDEWQKRDERIRVIHKQNEGLPYARKTGIDNATAEYVTFVDADDWIDVNMYADMMSALLSTHSDIAQCEFCMVYEDGKTKRRDKRDTTNSIEILGHTEGVLLILKDMYWRTSFWTKIFKKALFQHIEFYKDRGFGEDLIVHKLYHHASQTVLLNREYYFYYQSNDSITRGENVQKQMKAYSDFSDAYYERYIFTKQYLEYHNALSHVKLEATCVGINLLRCMLKYPQCFTDEYFKVKSEQIRSISFNRGEKLPIRYRLDLYLLKVSPKSFKMLRSLYFSVIKVIYKPKNK